MADTVERREAVQEKVEETVGMEDLVPVTSRISWAAIFAGAVMALGVYLVLTLLGGAIGLSVNDDVSSGTLSTGAAIWAIVTTILALFVGGWVCSQCTVGENKMEAVVHGIIVWGVVLFMTLWLVGMGVQAGFAAMWGVANVTETAAAETTGAGWEAMARQAGVPQDQIDQWKSDAASTSTAAADPANREQAEDYATAATWYTLLGTLLSMASAIGGAILGAGPTFRLLTVPTMTRREAVYYRR
jgi:hypothetical protein